MTRGLFLKLALLTTAAVAPQAAHAQATAGRAAQAGASPGLEEIVVTARKQTESLLDVPLAITALTGADLQRRQVSDLSDLTRFTPGFFYNQYGTSRNDRSTTTSNLVFRGMRLANFSGVGAGAAVFIDGAPLVSAVVDDVGELDRVEVIRGPQSAYFGRGTFAGAVNLVTRKPSDVLTARIDLDVGSYERRDGKITVEGPLIADKLSFRLSARDRSEGGQYNNNAAPGQKLGEQSTRAFTGTLYATPTDKFTAKVFFRYLNFDDGPGASAVLQANQYNCDAGLGRGRFNYFCGSLPKVIPSQIGVNPVPAAFTTQVLQNRAGLIRLVDNKRSSLGLTRDDYAANVNLSYRFDNGFSIVATGSYDESERLGIVDSDGFDTSGTRNPAFPGNGTVDPTLGQWVAVESDARDASQEVRLVSPVDRWISGSLGLSHIYQNVIQANAGLTAAGPSDLGGGQRDIADTLGLFGALSVKFASRWTLDLEGRYQVDKIHTISPRPAYLDFNATYKSFTPRVILSYKPQDDVTAYVQYSRGVRPGSFNAGLTTYTAAERAEIERQTSAGLVVDQEYLDNYEIGLKGRFLDGRVQGSVDAYLDDWKDQQVRSIATLPNAVGGGSRTVTVIGNLGVTRLTGIEAEGQFQATSRLQLGATFSWNHSDLRTYFCATCLSSITGNGDVTGNQIQKAPEYTGSASATWRDRLTDTLEWYARGDFTYQSKQYETEANVAFIDAQKLLNLRIGLEGPRYTLESYVLNATDDDNYVGLDRSANAVVGGNIIVVGLPQKRRFGVRASYRF